MVWSASVPRAYSIVCALKKHNLSFFSPQSPWHQNGIASAFNPVRCLNRMPLNGDERCDWMYFPQETLFRGRRSFQPDHRVCDARSPRGLRGWVGGFSHYRQADEKVDYCLFRSVKEKFPVVKIWTHFSGVWVMTLQLNEIFISQSYFCLFVTRRPLTKVSIDFMSTQKATFFISFFYLQTDSAFLEFIFYCVVSSCLFCSVGHRLFGWSTEADRQKDRQTDRWVGVHSLKTAVNCGLKEWFESGCSRHCLPAIQYSQMCLWTTQRIFSDWLMHYCTYCTDSMLYILNYWTHWCTLHAELISAANTALLPVQYSTASVHHCVNYMYYIPTHPAKLH